MLKLTTQSLTKGIYEKIKLDKYVEELNGYATEEKLKKLLNEYYQYHPKIYSRVNKQNYQCLIDILDKVSFELKFIK